MARTLLHKLRQLTVHLVLLLQLEVQLAHLFLDVCKAVLLTALFIGTITVFALLGNDDVVCVEVLNFPLINIIRLLHNLQLVLVVSHFGFVFFELELHFLHLILHLFHPVDILFAALAELLALQQGVLTSLLGDLKVLAQRSDLFA